MNPRGHVCGAAKLASTAVTCISAIVLLLSACTTPVSPQSPEGAHRFQYNSRLFTMELKNIEVFDDSVKVTLMYTNRQDRPAGGQIAAPPKTLSSDAAYIVDDKGKRYRWTGKSFSNRQFAPQVPEEISINFAKVQSGATSVSLVVNWAVGTQHTTVTFRGIALPPVASSTGFRYVQQ